MTKHPYYETAKDIQRERSIEETLRYLAAQQALKAKLATKVVHYA